MREWWERASEGEDVHLLVVPRDGDGGDDGPDEPVGLCSLSGFNHKSGQAEVWYAIAPEAWGNGYATAAVELLCAYGFAERRLEKVTAAVYETNPASVRVLEKAGFTREARLRRDAFVEGAFVAVLLFGLRRGEWTAGDGAEGAEDADEEDTDERGDSQPESNQA